MTDIMACVQWMAPHAITIREAGSTELKFFPTIPPEDAHNIQTHAVDVTMLVKILISLPFRHEICPILG